MSEIVLKQLSKFYGAYCAVRDVSLEVRQGELFTILGPSGSGKSTLLGLIAGLTMPTSGSVLFGTRDVTYSSSAARNVGLVFQSYALFPHMSVFDNVAFPLRVRKVFKSDVEEAVNGALETVRLKHLASRRPSELSGGQQQRVALARAFVFKPDILLLDEPLGALDRKLREEVQVELRDLQRRLGITTVLVTHDQEEALSLSDRVMVLDQGQIRQVGTPEEVYTNPADRFVANFLGTANVFSGEVRDSAAGWVMTLKSGHSVPCRAPLRTSLSNSEMIVRPENIRLTTVNETAPSARIRDVIYLGQTVKYVLDGELGEIVASSNSLDRFRVGDDVTVTWDRTGTWHLAA
ncbi:MAG: ABC transporter ATP-binding protein [Shinella sp.]|nr:ABC transporter ATP-binding protein [Shinella sp.]